MGDARGPICVLRQGRQRMVIEAGAFQAARAQRKARGQHDMQTRPGIGAEADDIAGILWNLRLKQNDIEHLLETRKKANFSRGWHDTCSGWQVIVDNSEAFKE
jgi:hypothetical protein